MSQMLANTSMMASALAFLVSCSLAASDANELILSDGQADTPVDTHPPLPPAFTSDDLPALDGETIFGAEAIEDIVGRRRLGLPIPDEYYEQCHFWVNSVRSREGLPALQRWKAFEPCTDEMSEYDYFQHKLYGRAHAAMYDGVGCDFFATGATAFAQNSCPGWDNDANSIKVCTIAMWEEKVEPGVNPDTLDCLGFDPAQCGHYYNLRGGDSAGKYNTYDKVACGFYVDPETERLYINQNFGAGNDFLCGGDLNTKPNTSRLVDDCSVDEIDYSGCSGLDGIAEPEYHLYACTLVNCDLDYAGPCENRLVNDFDACEHFDIKEPSDCEPNRFWRYNHPDSPNYYFSEYCRVPCKTCSCEDKLNGIYNTHAPTPTPPPGSPTRAPTAFCDPDYAGPCEDAMPELCEEELTADDVPCSHRWRFSATGTYVVDECRKTCGQCGCDAPTPASTPSPTESPTQAPSPSSTPSPTESPTEQPTQDSSTPSPTESPTEQPTQDSSTPSPTDRPTDQPTQDSSTPSPTESPTDQPTQDSMPSPTTDPTKAPIPSPTPVPTFLVTDDDKCPWLTPTDERAKMECQDGSFCNGWADGWSCCKSRGGRKRCPIDMPLMCVDTCNGTNCCGGDHCCETDCSTAGGEKPCDEPVATPAPTDSPTQSPTGSPTQSPTDTPSPPCDDLMVGIPQGVRIRMADVETACACAAQCPGQIGFVHFPKRNRCWCVESFNGDVTDSDAVRNSRRFYQLFDQDEVEA